MHCEHHKTSIYSAMTDPHSISMRYKTDRQMRFLSHYYTLLILNRGYEPAWRHVIRRVDDLRVRYS